ncbi:MAG: LysM peptidoglycan-binding domain-containing protein, partial [Actinomycetota bacterium]
PAARPSAPPVATPVDASTTTPVPAVVDPSGTHRVAPGEHLWGIAAAVVRARTGGDELGVIDRYWRALCAANADRIASGDVDRIHPGEDLLLPPGP